MPAKKIKTGSKTKTTKRKTDSRRQNSDERQETLFPVLEHNSVDDVIIIGGGLAGLFCALKMAPRPVTILTAANIGRGASSAWAQAGIAAAVSPGDTVEQHLADTIAAGAGIVDEKIAHLMIAEASERIDDLLKYGVPFDRDLEGALITSREAAHSQNRVVRVKGDGAGKAIMEALVAAVHQTPSIRLLEGYIAEEIITEANRVTGLIASSEGEAMARRIRLPAKALVMAAGGSGSLFSVTTNPQQASGTACGMAARAGAVIADPEFVQFHPTAINVGKNPAPLATEALRGEGCTLHNDDGERFMLKIDPKGEMAPRDIVARGIFAEIAADRGAWLDCTKAVGKKFKAEFPTVFTYCKDAGIDPAKKRIPVIPAAHYHMGGILTDANGCSTIDGLWACGEATSTGAHGANRLASNSLLEAVVFAGRIAENIVELIPDGHVNTISEIALVENPARSAGFKKAMKQLRQIMGDQVGVVRDGRELKEALLALGDLGQTEHSSRFANRLATAKLIAGAALLRQESRGGHFRSDFPNADDAWQKRTYTRLDEINALVDDLRQGHL